MTNKGCVLKRNIPALVNSPEDESLSYLKEHIKECPLCKDLYSTSLNRVQVLESWIPLLKPTDEFNKEIGKDLSSISREISDIIDGTDLKREFLNNCFRDLLSIFKSKINLIFITSFILLIIFAYKFL